MSDHRQSNAVENYTNAFLVSFGLLLFTGLFAVWAVWGLLAAVLGAWMMDRFIAVGDRAVARRTAVAPRRGR